MNYTNEMKATMINAEAAVNAKAIIEDILSKKVSSDYKDNPMISFLEDLEIKDNVLSLDGDNGYFIPEDAQEIFEEIVKALAACGLVKFNSYNESTYSESCVEATISNGKLEVETVYYPCGYCEYLECPECGEFVVKLEDYDPNATYHCPECGEEIDLSEQYKEVAPIVKKYAIWG